MLEVNKIHCGDALELLEQIDDHSVDVVITDPPFFMPATHYQSRIHWQRKYSDMTPLMVFWDVVVGKLVKVLKKTGHLFVFCNGDSYPVFYIPLFNNFDRAKSLVWNKTRVGLGRIFRGQHELIIWGRWQGHKWNDDGICRPDVLSFPPLPSQNRCHPVEKPVELMRELIKPTSSPGDLILDPFMGSGPVIAAAIKEDRSYLGIDVDPEYCIIADERIKRETAQLEFNWSASV